MTRDVEATLLVATAFLASFAVGFAAWAGELPPWAWGAMVAAALGAAAVRLAARRRAAPQPD
jgi:hypothetical protein